MKYLLYYKVYNIYRYLGYIEKDPNDKTKLIHYPDMGYHFGIGYAKKKKQINDRVKLLSKKRSVEQSIEFLICNSRYMLKSSENTDTVEKFLSVESLQHTRTDK